MNMKTTLLTSTTAPASLAAAAWGPGTIQLRQNYNG